MTLPVALVGCGRWGSRMLEALVRHPRFEPCFVVDDDEGTHARARRLAPSAQLRAELEPVLEHVAAVVVASPSPLHAEHALAAMAAGCDVLIEKPMATRHDDAETLCEAAERLGRVGMVGHILRYHTELEALVDAVHAGRIGALQRVRFLRHTGSRSAAPLWTLAPHDLCTLQALDPSPPRALEVRESRGCIELRLVLESGVRAQLSVSTHSRQPARSSVVIGSEGELEVDELAAARSRVDPLTRELHHFADCIVKRSTPLTSFADACRIVATIGRAEALLRKAAVPWARPAQSAR